MMFPERTFFQSFTPALRHFMTLRSTISKVLLILFSSPILSQTVYLGAGGKKIFTTSSSELHLEDWSRIASADATVSGQGLDFERMEASRFLAQASLGADEMIIDQVVTLGMEGWIDDQIRKKPSFLMDELYEINDEVNAWFLTQGGDETEIPMRPSSKIFNYTWWEINLRNDDLLRHRVALALSEILVISLQSDLNGYGDALASYYDILVKHALGNYRDLLLDISLHPAMGFYLSHLNNPKAIPDQNIHPDENFAREIMQLFSIGLYELHPDGTRKKNSQGNDIPTYGQNEIKEMAKIWTGLSTADVIPNMYDTEPYFGIGIYTSNMTLPMQMYEEWHETGPKTLVGNVRVEAGQSGMQDIESAIEALFMHPNVGPFIGRLLIQRLVKSNPTPGYIRRVSATFDDNGSGVRGDMSAVVKAILLDQEARECRWLQDPDAGMLREPLVRYTHFCRALPIEQYYDRFWNSSFGFLNSSGQTPLGAKSVFNFFLPDHQPSKLFSDKNLVGPEFQIHNSRTGIGFINELNRWAIYNSVMFSWERDDPATILDISELKELAKDSEVLLNALDLLFTHGQLTNRTRTLIRDALDQIYHGDYREYRSRLAIYLILISPDYAILK